MEERYRKALSILFSWAYDQRPLWEAQAVVGDPAGLEAIGVFDLAEEIILTLEEDEVNVPSL